MIPSPPNIPTGRSGVRGLFPRRAKVPQPLGISDPPQCDSSHLYTGRDRSQKRCPGDHPSGRARIRMAMDWKAANLPGGESATAESTPAAH